MPKPNINFKHITHIGCPSPTSILNTLHSKPNMAQAQDAQHPGLKPGPGSPDKSGFNPAGEFPRAGIHFFQPGSGSGSGTAFPGPVPGPGI